MNFIEAIFEDKEFNDYYDPEYYGTCDDNKQRARISHWERGPV